MSAEDGPLGDATRDAPGVKVFPPLIPLAAIALGSWIHYLKPIDVELQVSSRVRYGVGGSLLSVAILGFGAWAIVVFRRAGESELPWRSTVRVVQHGPYRFTRNPMYVQLVLFCVGVAILLTNVWILLLTPICAWLLERLAIVPEERYLERKFGEEYLAYKRRVRRWL